RDCLRRSQHPLAGPAAGPGNAPAPLCGEGRTGAPHRAAGRLRDCLRRSQHPLAGPAAGPGNAPAPLCGEGRTG
ncbi:hypothetical protein C7E18_23980, partial [Stenotrophomonas maltophilia]